MAELVVDLELEYDVEPEQARAFYTLALELQRLRRAFERDDWNEMFVTHQIT